MPGKRLRRTPVQPFSSIQIHILVDTLNAFYLLRHIFNLRGRRTNNECHTKWHTEQQRGHYNAKTRWSHHNETNSKRMRMYECTSTRAIIIATKFSFSRSRPDAQLHSKICTQLYTYRNIYIHIYIGRYVFRF